MSWILLVLVGLVAAYFFYTNCMKLTKQEQENLDNYLIYENKKFILKQDNLEEYLKNLSVDLDDYHFREALKLVKQDIESQKRHEAFMKIRESQKSSYNDTELLSNNFSYSRDSYDSSPSDSSDRCSRNDD